MTATSTLPTAHERPLRSVRLWGVLVLVLFLLTVAVGGSLALESSYLPITLASHIGLALVTLGAAVYGAAVLARPYRTAAKASIGLAALSALGATIAGTLFLLAGQSDVALYAMEGWAALGIVGSILAILFGGESGKRSKSSPPSSGVPGATGDPPSVHGL